MKINITGLLVIQDVEAVPDITIPRQGVHYHLRCASANGKLESHYRVSRTGIELLRITLLVVLPRNNSRRRLWP